LAPESYESKRYPTLISSVDNSLFGLDERGMDLLKEYGYIPCDKTKESVAISMEYALADWAVAQIAKKLGKQEDYEYFVRFKPNIMVIICKRNTPGPMKVFLF